MVEQGSKNLVEGHFLVWLRCVLQLRDVQCIQRRPGQFKLEAMQVGHLLAANDFAPENIEFEEARDMHHPH